MKLLLRLCAGVFSVLWLVPPLSKAAQFVEVHATLESTHWANPAHSIGSRKASMRFVVGTNRWFFENSVATPIVKEQIWYTRTNLVRSHEVTRGRIKPDTGEFEIQEIYRKRPMTNVEVPPLRDLAYVGWLAFMSGPYFEGGERDVVLPFPSHSRTPMFVMRSGVDPTVVEKLDCFPDGLGLPKELTLATTNATPICTYSAQASTNIAGWFIPLSFKLMQRSHRGQQRTEVIGKVTAISLSQEPHIPPEVFAATR